MCTSSYAMVFRPCSQLVKRSSRSQEMVSIQDCLWGNLHQFDYIAVFDLDEVIVPQVVFVLN